MLQPLLPLYVNTHRFGGGRPRVSDRACADAIFYVLRTGCQWGALDATDLCPHSTAHDRFQAWVAAGVFLKLWQAGVEQFAGQKVKVIGTLDSQTNTIDNYHIEFDNSSN